MPQRVRWAWCWCSPWPCQVNKLVSGESRGCLAAGCSKNRWPPLHFPNNSTYITNILYCLLSLASEDITYTKPDLALRLVERKAKGLARGGLVDLSYKVSHPVWKEWLAFHSSLRSYRHHLAKGVVCLIAIYLSIHICH